MGKHLYCGDNLTVLRGQIRESSVDLIYLDPPFNSNASYNVLFKGPSGRALLHKSGDGLTSPFPGQTCPANPVMGVPGAVKPLRTAIRTWTSAS